VSKLGKTIKRLRTERGLSQRELAAAAGMGQSDISKLERGAVAETTGIVRLAIALDVSPVYLETADDRYAGLGALGAIPLSEAMDFRSIVSMTDCAMAPTLMSGDLLVIDSETTMVADNAIYAFSLNETLFVRRLFNNGACGTMTARPDNTRHPSFVLGTSTSEKLQIHGRARFAWRTIQL